MTRLVVVGGGVVGTMHAREALGRGYDVVQLEADHEPRGATVRNFGLVWVSGRARGEELALALRAREQWAAIGARVPGVGFRAAGSLTIAQRPDEAEVLREVAAQADADERGVRLMEPDEARILCPALRGKVEAALHCRLDALVEPGLVLPAIRAELARSGRYELRAGRTVVDVDTGSVRDHLGSRHQGDAVVLCPGAVHEALLREALEDAPLRRCRLQMMQTAPFPPGLPTALADGDSLRYYPAFDVPAAAALEPRAGLAEERRIQLLVAPRGNGELTIGDTHEYEEPFPVFVDEAPYDHLRERAESLLGVSLPPVRRRWSGVYSQVTDGSICWRAEIAEGVVVVTGLGGRGMTLAPAVAADTITGLDRGAVS